MVYQFVGDVFDVDDQLSDKHKISLFDDSRYEAGGTLDNDILGGVSIQNQSLTNDILPSQEVKTKKKGVAKILTDSKADDPLAGGDSLYEEHLISHGQPLKDNASCSDDDDDDDSSSSSSSNDDNSDDEED